MSYTKTVWRDGDVITAAKMNKIETGIEQSGGESPTIIDLGDNSFDYNGEDLEFTIQTGLTPAQLTKVVIKVSGHFNGDTESPLVEVYETVRGVHHFPSYNVSIVEMDGLGLFYYPETGLVTTEQPNFANPTQPPINNGDLIIIDNPNPPVQEQLA